jgi:hypothetical protein
MNLNLMNVKQEVQSSSLQAIGHSDQSGSERDKDAASQSLFYCYNGAHSAE